MSRKKTAPRKKNRSRRRVRWTRVTALFLLLLLSGCLIVGLITHFAGGTEETAEQETDTSGTVVTGSLSRWYIPSWHEYDGSLSEPDTETGFVSGWYASASDGAVSASTAADRADLVVSYSGQDFDSVQYYRDGIPFAAGSVITVSFAAACASARTIRVEALDADTAEVLYTQDVALSADLQTYTLSFEPGKTGTLNGRLCFALGNDGQGADAYAEISLQQIRVVSSLPSLDVHVNQIGYYSSGEKQITVPYQGGDTFDVVNADTGEVVYTGVLLDGVDDSSTGERDYLGDFSDFTTAGTYYIRTQIGIVSNWFTIADQPYEALETGLLHMLALQRCGIAASADWAGELSHDLCHSSTALLYGTDETLEVSGGWHDAGDYGRYVKTGTKTVSDLLLAYSMSPDSWSDDTGSPDSGNGIPDILDEARWELEWMLKMQAADGSVYSKVVTAAYAGFESPAADTAQLYVLGPDTATAGDFAGVMALAFIVYQQTDAAFAQTCLQAAQKADSWLDQQTDVIVVRNPSDFQAGTYYDEDDADARFYAKAALYAATGDIAYLRSARSLLTENAQADSGVSWQAQGGYGRYILLTHSRIFEKDPAFARLLRARLTAEAGVLESFLSGSSYRVSVTTYGWGSNGDITNNGIVLAMAFQISGSTEYQNAASEQLNYVLGRNSLNYCFVSGYGSLCPEHVHSRLSIAANALYPGALVGGADSYREDEVTQALPEDTADAKIYADDENSYSTNEIAIYWNSALLTLLAMTDSSVQP